MSNKEKIEELKLYKAYLLSLKQNIKNQVVENEKELEKTEVKKLVKKLN